MWKLAWALVSLLVATAEAQSTRFRMEVIWATKNYPRLSVGRLGLNGSVTGTMLVTQMKQRMVTVDALGAVVVHLSPYDQLTEGMYVNRHGDVAGMAKIHDDAYTAAVWRDGKYVEIGWIGGSYSWASGINDLGWVTGLTSTGTGTRAFLWRDGAMVAIPRLTNNPDLEAVGITNRGEVYGNESNYDGGYQHTFVWTEAGGIRPLFPESAFVRDMNNWGQAVGRVIRRRRAAVLVGGAVRELDGDWAYAINDQGTIIGQARGGTEVGDALVWFDLYKRYKLADLVDNLGGVLIDEALDIDDDGRILVRIRNLPQGISGLAVLTPTNRPDLLFIQSVGSRPEDWTH